MTTIDVGDPLPIEFRVYNSSGVLATPGAITCTLTAPDGTTTTPALTASATGVYALTTTAMATTVGRWTARGVATGANASSTTLTFNVQPATPATIIGLAEARTALNWPSTDTTNDEELRSYLEAATEVVEDIVGPVITRTYSEQHRSGGSAIALAHYPVLAVSSLVSYAPSATTWTVAATPDVASGNQFTLDATTGVVTARGSKFTGEVWVTYTAGRSVTPPAIREACVEIVKSRWQASQQTLSGMPGVSVSGTSGKTYVVPYLAEALLRPYMQAGGFA